MSLFLRQGFPNSLKQSIIKGILSPADEGSKAVKRYTSLVEMQEDACRIHADRPLYGSKIKDQWIWLNYRDFAKYVDQIRGALKHLGFKEGETVAIISRNCVEWVVAAYATYGLRGRFVAMYETQSSAEWEYILEDSKAAFVFAHNSVIQEVIDRIAKKLPSIRHAINIHGERSNHLSFETLLKLGAKHPCPAQTIQQDDIMGIIYTSGTTDKPKGVLLSHGNILSQIEAVKEIYTFTPEDRTLAFLPWAHVFGQTCEVHITIALGFSSAICDNVSKILENLAEISPTMLLSVPRIFNRIYENVLNKIHRNSKIIQLIFHRGIAAADKRRRGLSLNLLERLFYGVADKLVFKNIRDMFGGRLKYAISGGAALQREIAEFIANLGITVYEGYGLSETSPLVTANSPTGVRIGSVGRAMPGVRVVIDTSVGDSLIPGAGEIIVYGPNVMQGYHNLPGETAKVMTDDGGFRTGDVGYLDPDQYLVISGRVKEQFKLQNGKYVVPNIIEGLLNLNRYVSQSLLYGDNREYTIAIINVHLDELLHHAKAIGAYQQEHDVLTADEIKNILDLSKIRDLYTQVIKEQCKDVKSYEVPRKFLLTAEEWSPNSGLLTQSFKLKRTQIIAHYAEDIDLLYNEQHSFLEGSSS